ncbi:hypothetical protein [Paraglaciecola sp.]|uniref:hypothetical protein n=1 Tax=Paraglaciecola sp. TaxID=1920173 RepID=UPI0030F3BDC8
MPVLQAKADNDISPNCIIIYSLQRNAEQYFVHEVTQLSEQLKRQNIYLIDLNNWYNDAPYLRVSGRERSLLREQFQLLANINQAIVLNSSGQEISRHIGSVTLVNAIMNCAN